MEALDEEMESELDLMQFLVDAMGYLLKMHRCVRVALCLVEILLCRAWVAWLTSNTFRLSCVQVKRTGSV